MARPRPDIRPRLPSRCVLTLLVLLAGCASGPAREHVVRSWDFESDAASAGGGLVRITSPGKGGVNTVASAVRTADGRSLVVQLPVQPPLPVGAPALLRFRLKAEAVSAVTVQMFDLTAGDNRHIELKGLTSGTWRDVTLDFTRDSRRNDGSDAPFRAGNRVDDIFFFVHGAGSDARLLVDDVTLYSPSSP